ncbi:radical SAM protein [Flavobacterium oreochromis]|uniref:Radical SAM protein n=2 Tax=Flavobacterium TaxID=237 RepID=A0A246G823_9FLAO|nr:radical SAM protein [Flavobacterium oreochromis]OWP74849.1 radical SAM protein [Flavobacterium oreochromis]OWP75276.1 radical SAM protein [Flavobacterium oreochromis]
MPTRDYIYYDTTQSICPECLHLCNAKIIFKDEKVWMLKHCKTHGESKVMIADDVEYYRQIRNYNKQSEIPLKFNTKTHYGCPYDCGLCPDHEQHSCLSIIEVTDRCNLTCPTCYASSAPNYGNHRTLEEIEKMFDAIVANEGEPDVVQISGGEPTVHPQFFEILDLAKSKPIKHLMVNTNGIRIAKDISFVQKLASYMPDFEIYLQFDSFKPEVLKKLRGEDLTEIRKKAIENLNQFNLSTTLVITLQKGENDDEIGKILEYALEQKCVRGVTFQPTQVAGRNENYNDNQGRITLTEVRRKIYEQYPIFTPQDLIPVPCNPDALCMAYALKMNGEVFPMTNLINPEDLLNNSKNTIVFESDEKLKNHMLNLFSTGISVDCAEEELGELMCCLPRVKSDHLHYDNLFRIIIMNFMDAHDFDVRAVKKSCVHIVDKKGKLIPFETMNLFYRDESIKRIRKEII